MGRVDVVVRREGEFERLYACKRLHGMYRDDAYFRGMFLDEARVAGMLRHGNAVSVLDVGEDEDGPFLLMDYIEGVPLHHLVSAASRDAEHLPVQLCVSICAQIAEGLHAAHELEASDGRPLNLVHRDVSPQNVIVGYDGIVRLTDFGIAKALGQSTRTQTGLLKGKFGYMSPEQLRFEEPDRRSDLFSLGVVLYEALSGERLYRNLEGMDGTRRLLEEPPPDIGEVRSDVPHDLVELSFELLAKKAADRPPTALAVARRLESIRAELIALEGAFELVDFVSEMFADRREAERKSLAEALRAQRAHIATAVPDETAQLQARPRWSYALAAAGALSLGGALAWSFLGEAKAPPSIATKEMVTVVVDSQPSDAIVRVEGELRGRTPLSLELERRADALSIAVERDGYEPVERSLEPSSNQTIHVSLVARQPPAEASTTASAAASTAPPASTAAPTPVPRPTPPAAAPKPSSSGDWFKAFN
jgi:eukaryotic-like serine/threonine-protein kinase